MKTIGFLLLLISLVFLSPIDAEAGRQENDPNTVFNSSLFQAMKFRNVGPSRGGRVTAVSGVPGEPFTFLFGGTGGGVWKTTSAGEEWENITMVREKGGQPVIVPKMN